jgi:hypothetical protein
MREKMLGRNERREGLGVVTLADLCVTRGKFFRRDWSG